MQYHSVRMRLASAEDGHLPTYDFTKLSAYNTCPTWGELRYGMHKQMPGSGRAMALEAGEVSHQFFAAVRLWQLHYIQKRPDLAERHGNIMFGPERMREAYATQSEQNDDRINCRNFALTILSTSGYIDDVFDKRRTFSNIEAMCMTYVERWEFDRYPVFINDEFVGIEIPFDIVIEFYGEAPKYTLVGFDQHGQYKEEQLPAKSDATPVLLLAARFVGKIDGLHTNGDKDELIVQENKTGGRIDNTWGSSIQMSHQITGYVVAASVIAGANVRRAIAIGAQLPLPKLYVDGIRYEPCYRDEHHIRNWLDWFFYTVSQAKQWKNNPQRAPKFTHSCSRYFRPCSFIPFCHSDEQEMEHTLSQMVDDEWSPLHDRKDSE